MHQDFIKYRSSRIHYCRWGSGPRVLLCFHGYGESAASFAFLEPALGGEYTIIAFDMPFHGETQWAEDGALNPNDLFEMTRQIIVAGFAGSARWTLLGYSMGGRLALQLLQTIPEKIERLVLLAPDGLKLNPWYWFATQTSIGNRLFRWTMENPGWFFTMLRIGNKLRLVNPSIYKFTVYYIGDETVRRELYTRWTVMRRFRPNLTIIRTIIASNRLPVRLLFGRFDRIIRQQPGQRFRRGIENECRIQILPGGHQLLQPANLDIITRSLRD